MDATSPRRRRWRSLLWLAALVCLLTAPARSAELDDANRLFEAGRFGEAKQRYEQLIASGRRTANLFYDLGNADYRLGSPGRAMLDYERALALQPTHPEAQRNLALLRERSGARVPARQWYDGLFPVWTGNAFAILAAAAAWTAVLSFAALVLLRNPRPAYGWLGIFAALLAIYAGAGLWRVARSQDAAIVTAREAVARLAPADQSGVATTLPAGSRVRVLSERGDWIYCELPAEGLGWLPAGTLERVRI